MNEIDEKLFSQTFGCPECRATPETDTKFDSLPYKKIKTLYDKSDNSFHISECSYCNQPYLEEFRDDGMLGGFDGDPMWWYWMPLTAKELAILIKEELSLEDINKIMRTRSFLINENRDKSTFEWA